MINYYCNKSYELDDVYFFLEARSLEVFGSGSLLADGLWWLDWWVTGQSEGYSRTLDGWFWALVDEVEI